MLFIFLNLTWSLILLFYFPIIPYMCPYGHKYPPQFYHRMHFPSKLSVRLQFSPSTWSFKRRSSVLINYLSNINTFSGKHEVFPPSRVSMEMRYSDLRLLFVIQSQTCERCAVFWVTVTSAAALWHKVGKNTFGKDGGALYIDTTVSVTQCSRAHNKVMRGVCSVKTLH